MRILALCTHNSARSQMAEGWLRHYAHELGLEAEVASAGTEKTRVKPDAITVMAEVGINLSQHTSKTLYDLLNPWQFDVVMTVCDSANEACPTYPASTTRLHVAFPDPSGQSLDTWRTVRDDIGKTCHRLITLLNRRELITEARLQASLLSSSPTSQG
ncbi:MAG: arsenate reductase ArsC [Deinococcota bacterium]